MALTTKSPLFATGTTTRWPKKSCTCAQKRSSSMSVSATTMTLIGPLDSARCGRRRRRRGRRGGRRLPASPPSSRLPSAAPSGKADLRRAGDARGQRVALARGLKSASSATGSGANLSWSASISIDWSEVAHQRRRASWSRRPSARRMPARGEVEQLGLGGQHVAAVEVRLAQAEPDDVVDRAHALRVAGVDAARGLAVAGDLVRRPSRCPRPRTASAGWSRSCRSASAGPGAAPCRPRHAGRRTPARARRAARTGRSRTASSPTGSADGRASARRCRRGSPRRRARSGGPRRTDCSCVQIAQGCGGTRGRHELALQRQIDDEQPDRLLLGCDEVVDQLGQVVFEEALALGLEEGMTSSLSAVLVPARPK